MRAGCSCCARRRTSSSPRASTPPRWTTSPTGPASASRCSTSTSRASGSCTWRCSRSTSPSWPTGSPRRWAAPTTTAQRVDAAVGAYFDFIDAEGEAFRLVFESDLRNDADVRAIVDRGTQVCVEAIAEVIAADTGADPERALLLASGLTGLSETSARWWLPRKGTVSRDEAVALMSALAWRGISGFPRVDERAA